mgnify:CR=1 FL=1
MLYQIRDGTVSLGGTEVLSHIDFEIKASEKIAVTGINGAGKTTLLRLLAGELTLDRDDRRQGPGIFQSRKLTVKMLKQQAFDGGERTVEEELLAACPAGDSCDAERFAYEREYDRLFVGFGFDRKDKKKRISRFSGGEQTKIALIRLLLERPDVLLLDEPTNHLDIETVEWLETYLKHYDRAVVMASHDRYFLDQTVEVVYELSDGSLVRYPGNYSHYREEKLKNIRLQTRAYERQQQEMERLDQLVKRFRNKPRKAAFARSKKRVLEKMEQIPRPKEDSARLFTGEINPEIGGSKWVFTAKDLKIGYDRALFELTFRVKRGQKIGILGPNGAGKTTFLKTVAGYKEALGGTCFLGNQITMGYFDQRSAEITSDQTVLEHFHSRFPSLTEKEARTVLGHYLFGGRQAAKQVKDLSGGEKARLVLAELLQSRPNFLVLDEPTNHMDIHAKETLESAFRAYTGTILFVSHDRYFVKQVADGIMTLEGDRVLYYPFGYDHYLERKQKQEAGETMAAQVRAEDQALIAGIRAVPRAERHRLREIPQEGAYRDWKVRLAAEAMNAAGEELGRLCEAMEELWERRRTSREFWAGEAWEEEGRYRELGDRRDLAWREWHERCLEWGEEVFFREMEGGETYAD